MLEKGKGWWWSLPYIAVLLWQRGMGVDQIMPTRAMAVAVYHTPLLGNAEEHGRAHTPP